MTDLAFRLALIIKVLMQLRTGQFDIETASLYSDINKEIYIIIPKGYSRYMFEELNTVGDSNTHVLLLKRAVDSLVQTARQWWKKFKEAMSVVPVDANSSFSNHFQDHFVALLKWLCYVLFDPKKV
jgi:hypothetical protein